ncbi:hypothetical protein [Pedobacter agri]|uniref:hypothetical protein n=1 Tax=Pedobacter agri TaxID=454586 RepID=UPI002788CDAF|nr:hypothetical protein [Pedobacter agri]MDQ1143047.1 hypothetical protein [Pedobacter agri]
MKTPDQEPQENEEIQNIEQFQIDRSSAKSAEGYADEEDHTFSAEEPDELEEDDDELENDHEGYTEEEIPFADGEGTQLDEAIDEPDETEEDEEI